MKQFLVRLIKGRAPSHPCGWEKVVTFRDAWRWRKVSILWWMDAYVDEDGTVQLFPKES